ncbi:large-conductance mechanosensitive channel protein MscL [Thiothrix subterranea]|uniref:Large-conductance mechanosensitive channel n=1 Tax=Thiothrix subterranea TaxID=2735563 RepID=A0AA51ML22_9GAMM|nr:large-conductance mechanosensitive channel protein MscL [Thiothrix subterranea]MDQ5770303.1 large-conductance mechanosensitive channel protein MscL [Thiothrix subterranea]WML85845.1 large-conductance mechanosensitive channel protein MscL [Thiothrix subterranea]
MSFISEFKEFAMKGNVVDLAVGVIIGAAFGKIVSAFVDGVVMPLLGLLVGGVDFSKMGILLKAGDPAAVPPIPDLVLAYGAFIQTVFDFTIVALAIFIAIKAMNKLKRKEEVAPAPAAPSNQEVLLGEIRDLLKQK